MSVRAAHQSGRGLRLIALTALCQTAARLSPSAFCFVLNELASFGRTICTFSSRLGFGRQGLTILDAT